MVVLLCRLTQTVPTPPEQQVCVDGQQASPKPHGVVLGAQVHPNTPHTWFGPQHTPPQETPEGQGPEHWPVSPLQVWPGGQQAVGVVLPKIVHVWPAGQHWSLMHVDPGAQQLNPHATEPVLVGQQIEPLPGCGMQVPPAQHWGPPGPKHCGAPAGQHWLPTQVEPAGQQVPAQQVSPPWQQMPLVGAPTGAGAQQICAAAGQQPDPHTFPGAGQATVA